MFDLQPLHDAILKGDAKTAKETTSKALAAGAAPLEMVQ
jgi:methanogenic corrinoid protein MtbC1